MFLYIMIIELLFLTWNMDWLNGLILIGQLHGYGFKSWRTYIKLYIFGIFGLDVNMERWGGNLSEWADKGGWKGSQGRDWMAHYVLFNAIFVLVINPLV